MIVTLLPRLKLLIIAKGRVGCEVSDHLFFLLPRVPTYLYQIHVSKGIQREKAKSVDSTDFS